MILISELLFCMRYYFVGACDIQENPPVIGANFTGITGRITVVFR